MTTLVKNGSYDDQSGYKFVKKYDPSKLVFTGAPSTGAYDLIVEHCAIAEAVDNTPVAKKKPNWFLIGGIAAGAVAGTGVAVVAIHNKLTRGAAAKVGGSI